MGGKRKFAAPQTNVGCAVKTGVTLRCSKNVVWPALKQYRNHLVVNKKTVRQRGPFVDARAASPDFRRGLRMLTRFCLGPDGGVISANPILFGFSPHQRRAQVLYLRRFHQSIRPGRNRAGQRHRQNPSTLACRSWATASSVLRLLP